MADGGAGGRARPVRDADGVLRVRAAQALDLPEAAPEGAGREPTGMYSKKGHTHFQKIYSTFRINNSTVAQESSAV